MILAWITEALDERTASPTTLQPRANPATPLLSDANPKIRVSCAEANTINTKETIDTKVNILPSQNRRP
jgi:hypothetical protein